VVRDLLHGELGRLALDDEGLEPPAPLLVLDADHAHLGDVRHRVNRVRDLARKDVLAAQDDHVVAAPLDEQPAVLVEPAGVPGGHRVPDPVLAAAAGVAPEGVQRVIDVDIGANIQLEAAVLAAGGIVSAYADPSGPFAAPRPPMLLNAAEVRFVLVYTMPDAAKRAAVTAISAAINERALTPPPATRFSLSDVAAAHDAVELGTVGKVLIDIRLTTPASLTRPQERSNE
jgi:hypothetical protein